MICKNCGYNLNEGWNYCPKCGIGRIRRKNNLLPFNMFKNLFKSLGEDIRPEARTPQFRTGKGISIKISRIGGEPRIDVKEFGNNERIIKKTLITNEQISRPIIQRNPPAITREPETSIKKTDDKTIIEIGLPGIKSKEEIEIKKMQNSIEVKAHAGDTAYFKIINVPADSRITKKELNKENLILEVI